MLIKSREIEIPSDSPFLHDLLGRSDSAEVLTEFVLSTDQSLCICLDAPWGAGKTTFLRMWEQTLKGRGIPTIYFNAWENDFSDDALVCLIGEISAAISEIAKNGDETRARACMDTIKKVGTALVKKSIPIAAKILTAGALDLEKVVEDGLSDLAESVAKEQIEKYEKSKKSIASFRAALEELSDSLQQEGQRTPLVFIIDELDRCRPNFAVEILEKAKHFFNVGNIVFVLGADKNQLGSSVKALYGEGLNVSGYLRRFMDYEYILPTPAKGEFAEALFKKYAFNDYFEKKKSRGMRYEGEQAVKVFSELFAIYKLTLREQEQCCALLSIAIRTTPEDYDLHPLILCLLIVMKARDSDFYLGFISGDYGPDEILKRLRSMPGSSEFIESNYGCALEAYLATCRSGYRDFDIVLERYQKIIDDPGRPNAERDRADRIKSIILGLSRRDGIASIHYLLNKIEMASRFRV